MSSATPRDLPDPARSRAVLIGTSQYEDLSDLPEVERDIEGLRGALLDPRLLGLLPENCMSLLNSPTRWEVETAVSNAVAEAQDLLLIYFGGHGFRHDDGQLYLAVRHTEPGSPYATALPFDAIAQSLNRGGAKNTVVILDCSYAGAAGYPTMTLRRGAILAATTHDSHALVRSTSTDSVFTAFSGELIDLLRNGLPQGPDVLNLRAIGEALVPRLVDKRLPNAELFSTLGADNYPLLRNVALGRMGNKPSAEPTYVPRDHDPSLWHDIATTVPSGGLIVVAGDSASGKTRSARVGVAGAFPDWIVEPADTPELFRSLATKQIEPRTVIWLDDIGRYVAPDISPDRLQSFVDTVQEIYNKVQPEPILFVATVDTQEWANYIAQESISSVMARLQPSKLVTIESAFSEAELARAQKIAESDPRIAEALRNAEGGRVIQELSAATVRASGEKAPTTWEIRTRGYGDRPPATDLLQREAMIGALADLISPSPSPNEQDRSGPTVITLDGAWGIGKTSLVDLVEKQMDKTPRPTLSAKKVGKLRVYEADRALSGRGDPLWTEDMVVRGDPKAEHQPLIVSRFEPWAHQTSEQVWAGLTATLLGAVEQTLLPQRNPATARYWFQRNIQRVDRMRVRRTLRKSVLSPLLAVSAIALVVPLVAQMARSTDTYQLASLVIAGSNISLLIAGAMFLAGIGHSLWRFRRRPAADFLPADLFVGPVPSGTNDETLHDPYHNAKSGFLYLAQHDVFAVLRDVERSRHHMVVFIDDLDRCTPRTTAEVFEAINVFVTRHFPVTRFVLCLDTTTVAAHLDDVYASLKGKALHGDDPTPGWSFLRKLIQLPIPIPPIDPATVPRLLDNLLGEIRLPLPQATPVVAPEPTVQRQQPMPQAVAPALTQDAVSAVAEILEHDRGVRDLMIERLKEQESLSVREAKRVLTIWQYYVRVLVRLGVPSLAEQARHLVILAEIIARWPAAQRALHRRKDGVHGLELLAKAEDDWEWARALKTLDLHGPAHHKCTKGIRELLERYDGPRVAALAVILA
jgi:hypothetical protein